jgi:hypothetical protein
MWRFQRSAKTQIGTFLFNVCLTRRDRYNCVGTGDIIGGAMLYSTIEGMTNPHFGPISSDLRFIFEGRKLSES